MGAVFSAFRFSIFQNCPKVKSGKISACIESVFTLYLYLGIYQTLLPRAAYTDYILHIKSIYTAGYFYWSNVG